MVPLKRGGAVLKKLLEPPIEDGRLELGLVADGTLSIRWCRRSVIFLCSPSFSECVS